MDFLLDTKLQKKIEKIRALVLDVDGVMTDGRIIFDDDGRELKFFHVRDGHGLKMLIRAGLQVIILTGRTSRVVEHRARDLGITDVYQGAKDKLAVLRIIMEKKRFNRDELACLGDDITDVPLFKNCGFSVAVADACAEARKAADLVTCSGGGNGAVREICELLLKIQGKWADIAARYGL